MLTESEIFSQLQESLRRCEGCCRQIAHWRGDVDWLQLGAKFADLQKVALRLATRRGGIETLYIDRSRRN